MFTLIFPNIDPVLVEFGPLPIRWYSLAYIFGILLGWLYLARLNKKETPHLLTKKAMDDIILWAVLGIILGGRLGYILFYNTFYYLQNPLEVAMVWHGGMSFHGGLAGMIISMILFCRKFKIKFFALSDLVACVTPIGLFLGRLANFINGELFGRVTNAYIGMVFPEGGDSPRHPSQLYEAFLEGIVLFFVLFYLVYFTNARQKTGTLSGVFLVLYGVFRIFVEFFREPDQQLGFLAIGVTMGQILSIPMIICGAYFIYRARRKADAS